MGMIFKEVVLHQAAAHQTLAGLWPMLKRQYSPPISYIPFQPIQFMPSANLPIRFISDIPFYFVEVIRNDFKARIILRLETIFFLATIKFTTNYCFSHRRNRVRR
jgi:hypothetical protein